MDQGEVTMNTIHTACARLCAMFFVLLFCSTAFGGAERVDVCHIPPSDPENFHTIRINQKAEESHLNHGDLQGACAEGSDDGCPCFTELEAGSALGCLLEENQSISAVFQDEITQVVYVYATGHVLDPITELSCYIQEDATGVFDQRYDGNSNPAFSETENEACLSELRTACGF